MIEDDQSVMKTTIADVLDRQNTSGITDRVDDPGVTRMTLAVVTETETESDVAREVPENV